MIGNYAQFVPVCMYVVYTSEGVKSFAAVILSGWDWVLAAPGSLTGFTSFTRHVGGPLASSSTPCLTDPLRQNNMNVNLLALC